ncbi:Uncharacterized protein FWK35_00009443 [Aphis craccivora]|uniref:Uncharacterized protein n=1 Tax=Aphis craccivora TaxID=307492 RepID=A0A6G0YIK2_APHCR|nr:Uncharacterized protein FWK35_00009443 [Aphis craccivora]
MYKNSERSDECIDLTKLCVFFFLSMYTRTYRNNAQISNFGGGFRFLVHWACHFLNFPIVFKSAGKNKQKNDGKREFLRKTSFRPNRFFYIVVIQKLITFLITFEVQILIKIRQNNEYLQIIALLFMQIYTLHCFVMGVMVPMVIHYFEVFYLKKY